MNAHGETAPSSRSSESAGRTPRTYGVIETLSAILIFFLVIASPWLYGTTEDWSIWTMNIGCYLLGLLLIAKICLRATRRFQSHRWEEEKSSGAWFRRIFFLANLLVLAYCLIAAVNARATFILYEQRFEYHDNYIPWLPYSYDSNLSWSVFWQYLGIFLFFWALRDWLLAKSRRERRRVRRAEDDPLPEPRKRAVPLLTDRIRWFLWALCLNGMVLAAVALVQRLDGTSRLLWLRESYWGIPDTTLGPYSYRSNGAQYLNLIWPVCVGFWWMLNEARRSVSGKPLRMGEGPHLILIPATIVVLVAIFISLSRGGAVVAAINFVLIFILLLFHRRTRWTTRIGFLVIGICIGFAAWFLAGDRLALRLKAIETERWGGRGEIWENSKLIAEDFKLFGSGPGTFRSVYQMYRQEPGQGWHAYLHDDWLETRITFGYLGASLILLNLVLLLFAWFVPGKIEAPFILPATLFAALAGCLVHAKFDFPFQTYSILFTFVVLCAILFCLSSRRDSPEF